MFDLLYNTIAWAVFFGCGVVAAYGLRQTFNYFKGK